MGLQEAAPADEDTDAAWSANADAITGLGFIYLAEPSRQPHTTRVGYPFLLSFEGVGPKASNSNENRRFDELYPSQFCEVPF